MLNRSGCAFSISSSSSTQWMLVDAVGEQAALIEADIAGRRADQAADRVALHVLRHVEAQQLDPERHASCLATSVLPTPVGPANR